MYICTYISASNHTQLQNIHVDCHIPSHSAIFRKASPALTLSLHIPPHPYHNERHWTSDNNAVAEHACCWWKNVAVAWGQHLKDIKACILAYIYYNNNTYKLTVAYFCLRSVHYRWFCCWNTSNCQIQRQQRQRQFVATTVVILRAIFGFVVIVVAVAAPQVQFSIMQFSLKTHASVRVAADTTADAAIVAVATSAYYRVQGSSPILVTVFFLFFPYAFLPFCCASCLARPAC